MKDMALLVLKDEDVVERTEPVHNLLCDEAHRGVLFVTNIRVVWSSYQTPDLNVSIPYLQVRHELSHHSVDCLSHRTDAQRAAAGFEVWSGVGGGDVGRKRRLRSGFSPGVGRRWATTAETDGIHARRLAAPSDLRCRPPGRYAPSNTP